MKTYIDPQNHSSAAYLTVTVLDQLIQVLEAKGVITAQEVQTLLMKARGDLERASNADANRAALYIRKD